MKAVYLEWLDSSSVTASAWVDERKVKNAELMLCKTIGFVLDETKEDIVIVNSFDGDKKFPYVSGDMRIPKCAIRKKRIVRWK